MDELELVCETGHTEELWKEIKGAAARLLGCDAGEIAFVRNTTEGINIVAKGLPFKSGDEVILTTHEHVGNSLTWLALTKQKGIVLRLFEPSTVSQAENLDRDQRAHQQAHPVDQRPACGDHDRVGPAGEGDLPPWRGRKGIWSFVDGAQTAGMLPFSLHDIGCDAYATSGHKWLMGPKETGLLYVRQSMLDTIRSLFVGAYSDGGFDFLKGTMAFHPTAQRYEYGTVSIPLRCGPGGGVCVLATDRDRRMCGSGTARFSARLYEGLRRISGVTVLSPADPSIRSAMITFMHTDGCTSESAGASEHVQSPYPEVTEGGLAALRISTHIYNSFAEVDGYSKVIERPDTTRSAS